MAFGAHQVPGLPAPGPVQPVVGAFHLVGRQSVPLFLLNIPGDVQTLQPAFGKRHQVLLQGVGPEGVGDLECTELPIRALGLNHELLTLAIEAGDDLVVWVGIGDITEVAEDGFVAGHVHGQVVMGAAPLVVGALVAFFALLAANERGRALSRWRFRRP